MEADEPLNLTIKKMPIAIVAPFTIVEPKANNAPEDLSTKPPKGDQGLDLTKTKDTNLEANLSHNEQLRKYLCKTQSDSDYHRNTFTERDKLLDLYKNLPNDSIYSFINNLTDHKLLNAWYMNAVLAQQNPYLNPRKNEAIDNNRILNNLLDKKPYSSYKFPTNFDALIVNEMRPEKAESKKDKKGCVPKARFRSLMAIFVAGHKSTTRTTWETRRTTRMAITEKRRSPTLRNP